MADEELRQRLADLIVDALEVGTGKHERDVVDELFDAFGVDFRALEAQLPRQLPERTQRLRESARNQLAQAAPTAPALLNEIVRCGGRFVAMVEEVYARLARHSTTTSGTSDTFRLQRRDVDEEQLTISEAFIERVRHLVRALSTIKIGRIDESALDHLIGPDNGELYGRWPAEGDGGDRLADAVLHLTWVAPTVENLATTDARWERAASTVGAARGAAERFAAEAETLVGRHVAHLSALADEELAVAAAALYANDITDWRQDRVEAEIKGFRSVGILGTAAFQGYVSGIDRTSVIGVDRDLSPVVSPTTDYWSGTGVSALAGFLGMWRLGRWAIRGEADLREQLLRDPDALVAWLEWVTTSCGDAANWLAHAVFLPTGDVDASGLVESVEEFLNLPLWRQRALLYEVWVLCATFDACEQAGWLVQVAEMPRDAGVWVLSVGPTDEPTASLRHAQDPTLSLDVWREPNRHTATGVVTPDVTVATPGRHPRDLLVVEAKDRQLMSAGDPDLVEAAVGAEAKPRSALPVAWRYVAALRPVATWVCNHCDFRQRVDPTINYGNAWTRVHVAAAFRPGNVPTAFAESVRVALAPPPDRIHSPVATSPRAGLIVVADMTGSMTAPLREAWPVVLSSAGLPSFGAYRAVVYSDHGHGEPYLVRKLGPFPDLTRLVAAVTALPSGHGSDDDEALEDAMQRCHELVADLGPQTLIVLTDAAPHQSGDCPYGIEFNAEVTALLDAGCHIAVADDWSRPDSRTWRPFEGRAGFSRGPLRTMPFLDAPT